MTNKLSEKSNIIALGFFDGLHTAHMRVLEETVKQAGEEFSPCVMLFDEHPRRVLQGDAVSYLLQNEKRDEMLKNMGITPLYVSFYDIKDMSPEEFTEKILVERFSASGVVCGYNYRFGKNASADSSVLRSLCEKKGISVTVCPEYSVDGSPVSSTRIRTAVENGDMEEVNKLLGFHFCYSSEVFSGDKRGRLLGAPTINQFLPEGLAVPKFGVYASKVFFDGKEYTGVTNIGSRPTFQGESVRSETYIIDYSGDLYGHTVEIKLYKFIREEKKFPDADALKKQIKADVSETEKYFSEKN